MLLISAYTFTARKEGNRVKKSAKDAPDINPQNVENNDNKQNKKNVNKPKINIPQLKKSSEINPLASAIFDMQRQELTSDVVSGAVCILVGIIVALVSIVKCHNSLSKLTVDADKILAYAWIAYAVTGFLIVLIGVYQIMKSFISIEQINEWTSKAESHVSPLQALNPRKVTEMNQSQSAEPAPTEGMAEEGSKVKKHFAFLGKKEEKKPDSTAIYNKFNPQKNAPPSPPINQPQMPPKAAPEMKQKFDYGIHEAKKKTFADKFLEENKEDPFAQYRKDLGIEEESSTEGFYESNPQFKRKDDDRPAAPPKQNDNGFYGNDNSSNANYDGFFGDNTSVKTNNNNDGFYGSKVSEKNNSNDDGFSDNLTSSTITRNDEGFFGVDNSSNIEYDGGFFSGNNSSRLPPDVEPIDSDYYTQNNIPDEQTDSISYDGSFTDTLLDQILPDRPRDEEGDRNFFADLIKEEESSQKAPPQTVKPPEIPEESSMPTVSPPKVPEKAPEEAVVKPPRIPKNSPIPTVRPPKVPKQSPMPTVRPPKVPEKSSQSEQGITPPPIPSQNSVGAMPPQQTAPQMYQPIQYVPIMPNMYQQMPNMQSVPNMPMAMPANMMSNQQPFVFVGGVYDSSMAQAQYTMGPFAVPQDRAYNPSMAPYTVHPFKPAQSLVQPEQSGGAYNPSMAPYTMHPYQMSSNPMQMPPQTQAYNSAMPPYTVHGFKSSNGDIAAPTLDTPTQNNESSNQMQMPPQTQAYNSAMPPYTVHGFKSSNGDIAAPTLDTPTQNNESSAMDSSYNSAMPPYTVHGFKPSNGDIAAPTLDTPKPKEDLAQQIPPKPQEQPPRQGQPQKHGQPPRPGQPPRQGQPPRPGQPPRQGQPPRPGQPPKPVQSPKPPQADKPIRQNEEKRSQRNLFTKRGENAGKKAPLTQKLMSHKSDDSGQKKSFSEKFLSRNGKKDDSGSAIVKGGTPAQRKFVDAADYDEWTCPGCGKVNQEYVGICACGERKPRVKW